MLINVNGILIETSHIYKISELKENKSSILGWHNFSFTISFINKNDLRFVINLHYRECTRIEMEEENSILLPYEGKEYPQTSIYRAKAFYQSIIEHWNKDKSPIPEIKI